MIFLTSKFATARLNGQDRVRTDRQTEEFPDDFNIVQEIRRRASNLRHHSYTVLNNGRQIYAYKEFPGEKIVILIIEADWDDE